MCITKRILVVPIKIGLFDIRFVPRTSWHRSIACLSNGKIWFGHKEIIINKNLRRVFGRIWERIRKREFLRTNYMCEICGSRENLHVHEVWEYILRGKEQRLVGYKVLCGKCHMVHHSSYLVGKGEIDDIVNYIVSTNRAAGIRIGRVIVEERLYRAYEIWETRSNYFWEIDIHMERAIWPFLDIAHILLNYWIIKHRRNNLAPWIGMDEYLIPEDLLEIYLSFNLFAKNSPRESFVGVQNLE